MLKWLHNTGCPWDSKTCLKAAEGGHLEVLNWAQEHHCPWDRETAPWAARGGHLEVLKWARAQGCPWDHYKVRGCGLAFERVEVVEWLDELRRGT